MNGVKRVVAAAAVVLALAPAASAERLTPDGSIDPSDRWPVAPTNWPHPVRGGFLDPRPEQSGPLYHTGVDISVRDDKPERGHPPGRAHRVFAIEGGIVWVPDGVETRSCSTRLVHVGNFGYGHTDPVGTVTAGQHVEAGDPIGWTCSSHWHVHLSEWTFRNGQQVYLNPLRPDGSLHPYVDTAAPAVHAIRFFTPADATWENLFGRLAMPSAGDPLVATALHGLVDVRAFIGDRQSWVGWMRGKLKKLRTEISPYRVHVSVRRLLSPKPEVDRDVFRADDLTPHPFSFTQRYAPGTTQNLPAYGCLHDGVISCRGQYWYRVFARPGAAPYWDTTREANGDYTVCVTAWDVSGNRGGRCAAARVVN